MGDTGFGSYQGQEISLLQNVHSDSRVYPTSYLPDTAGSFWKVQRSGRDADHLHPSGAEVKNKWSYTSTPHIRRHGVDRDNVRNSHQNAKSHWWGRRPLWQAAYADSQDRIHFEAELCVVIAKHSP